MIHFIHIAREKRIVKASLKNRPTSSSCTKKRAVSLTRTLRTVLLGWKLSPVVFYHLLTLRNTTWLQEDFKNLQAPRFDAFRRASSPRGRSFWNHFTRFEVVRSMLKNRQATLGNPYRLFDWPIEESPIISLAAERWKCCHQNECRAFRQWQRISRSYLDRIQWAPHPTMKKLRLEVATLFHRSHQIHWPNHHSGRRMLSLFISTQVKAVKAFRWSRPLSAFLSPSNGRTLIYTSSGIVDLPLIYPIDWFGRCSERGSARASSNNSEFFKILFCRMADAQPPCHVKPSEFS